MFSKFINHSKLALDCIPNDYYWDIDPNKIEINKQNVVYETYDNKKIKVRYWKILFCDKQLLHKIIKLRLED